MTGTTPDAPVKYDPYDVNIDNDPYPTWRRLRDECPLYRNEDLDFYAMSRWDDVRPALFNWNTYRSGPWDRPGDHQVRHRASTGNSPL